MPIAITPTVDADVVVVGGGPAGAVTAALLARAGVDVLVLERARFPREKACAEYLSPGAADVLERVGALADVLGTEVARPCGMRIATPRAAFTLTYDRRRAMGVRRPEFDAALLDYARSLGARVREGVSVLGAVSGGGRIVGVRTAAEAGQGLVRARFVVGADGLRSAVARSLGLELAVRWPRRLGLVARYADAAVGDVGEMHVGSGAYCGIAPVGRGLVNVGLVVPMAMRPKREGREAFFERALSAVPAAAARLRGARRVTRVRGVGPLARRVRRTSGPGYVLVGDAAGFLDPFTGEGVYRALRGAELAAEAVGRALSGDDQAERAYERARRDEFADKERLCLLVQLFLAARPLFDHALHRLETRPALARILAGALGDYAPSAPALRPAYVWSLVGAR